MSSLLPTPLSILPPPDVGFDSEIELTGQTDALVSISSNCFMDSSSKKDLEALEAVVPVARRALFRYSRQINRGELRQTSDVNLANLWDPEILKNRDHEPPPERLYDTLEEAERTVASGVRSAASSSPGVNGRKEGDIDF
jgi:hypothetical protein